MFAGLFQNYYYDEGVNFEIGKRNKGCLFAAFFLMVNSPIFAAVPNPPILEPASADCSEVVVRCAGVGQEYLTIQSAVDAARPGDRVLIRGGTYSHPLSGNREFVIVSNSGLANAPITIEAYPGESVALRGWGFSDDGSLPSNTSEVLMVVNGDFVTVRNIALYDSTKYGIQVNGDFGLFENLEIHDNWMSGIYVCLDPADNGDVTNNTFRFLEMYNNRHGSGFTMGPAGTNQSVCANNVVEYSLSYRNGYEPNGQKVDIIAGDPAGGGNSDGLALSKTCHDSAGAGSNLCPGFIARYNIFWDNADDGMDISPGDNSWIEGNVSFGNGPEGNRGFKVLRSVYTDSFVYVGNVALSNDARGFEPRSASNLEMYHNTALRSLEKGFYVAVDSSSASSVLIVNNLSYYNSSSDIWPAGGSTRQNNHLNDDATPGLSDPNFIRPITNLPSGTAQDRWMFVHDQVRTALTPAKGSSLIDQGKLVLGIHCQTADDDSQNPANPNDSTCRHWRGVAPDIGAFEAD